MTKQKETIKSLSHKLQEVTQQLLYQGKYLTKRPHRSRRCIVCGYEAVNTYSGEVAVCTWHEGHDDQGNILVYS